jgi:uncharacterized membrane protein YfcA
MMAMLILLAAGFLAGAMNALAGGGSFITLPVLIAVGVPSVAANASSTVALYPGGLASAWVYRKSLTRVVGASVTAMLLTTVAGGLVGAILLLHTPSSAFDVALPWLLLVATLALAFGPAIQQRWVGYLPAAPIVLPTQFLLGIYGGYFGGAVGLTMMAVWSLLEKTDIKALNGTRTVMVSAANGAAVLWFAAAGAVRWREALILGAAALLGGYGGAQLARRLDARVVRGATIALASAMTVLFFVRAAYH